MAANPFDAPGPLPSFLNDGQAMWNSAFPVLPRGPCNYTDPALPRCGCRRFWSKLNAAPDSAELCQCSHHACFHDDFPAPSQLPPTPSLAFAGLPPPYGQEKPNSGMSSQRARELLTPMEEIHPSFAAPTVSPHLGVSRDFGLMNFHASGFNQRVMASQPLQIQDQPYQSIENQATVPDAAPVTGWGNGNHTQKTDIYGDTLPLSPGRDFGLMNFHASGFNQRVMASQPLQIQDQPHQSIEKRVTVPDAAPVTGWGNGNHTQKTDVYGDTQPLSPGYFMQSQAPSTTASSQMRYMAPFFGKGLNTLTRPSAPRNEASIPEKGAEHVEEQAQANAQDVCGPMDLMVPPGYRRDMTPRPGSAHNQSFLAVKDDVKELSDVVNLQEQRIDRLENTSFSIIGHDECYDKHEDTDLRVTDLEYRVDEVEKILNDNASVAGASVVSAASNSTVRSSQKVTLSQFQALQAQISELQATSLPTYNKPWDLEVVFLPFPLKGIWVDARKIFDRRQSMGPDEDWTQLPNTLSRATPDPHDPGFSEWPGQYSDSGWLLPKAFANGRMIDQRLRSRGFIKTVQVRGPDARDVQLAIHKAFGNVLEPSSHLIYHRGKAAPESPLNEFLGLRQDWVPLRKIHRDNRLRFLAPAEMATPALWGFTFLMSSVVMKAPKTIGTHRLYITQPEAYIQDYIMGNRALMPGWTWQRIRELSRVYPEKHDPEETCSDRDDTPEADALEECWTWSDVLDEVPITDATITNLPNSHVQLSFDRSDTASFHTASSSIKANATRAESPRAVLRKGLKASLTRHAVKPYARPYDRRPSPLVPERSPFVPAEEFYKTPPTNASTTPTAPIKGRRGKHPTNLDYPRQTTPQYDLDRDRDRLMSRSPSLAPPNRSDRKSTLGYLATPHSEHPSSESGFHRGSSRGPLLPSGGYAHDSDQEMTGLSGGSDDGNDEDDEMTDCPIDGGATPRPESSSSSSESDSSDIDLDDLDQDDELDGAKTDGEGQGQGQGHGHGHGQERPLKSQDIPRAGIETDNEDFGPFSQHSSLFHDSQEDLDIDFDEGTQENGYDDDDGDGNQSDESEAPSEYPSKNISAALSPETTKRPSPLITSGSGSRSGSQSGSQQQQQQGYQQQYPYPRALTKSQNLVLEIEDLIRLGQLQPQPQSQVPTEAGSQELGETYVPRSSWTASTTTTVALDAAAATATVMPTAMTAGKETEIKIEMEKREGTTTTATEIGPSWVAWAETATGKWPGFEFAIHEDETRTE